MHLIKLDLSDADNKCYTNVSEYKFEARFLVFTIVTDDGDFVKAIPTNRIKHIQIEPQK